MSDPLTIVEVCNHLREHLQERMGFHEQKVSRGSCDSYPAYREMVGRIKEADELIGVLNELQSKYEVDDD